MDLLLFSFRLSFWASRSFLACSFLLLRSPLAVAKATLIVPGLTGRYENASQAPRILLNAYMDGAIPTPEIVLKIMVEQYMRTAQMAMCVRVKDNVFQDLVWTTATARI